jgi:hypothetical protein
VTTSVEFDRVREKARVEVARAILLGPEHLSRILETSRKDLAFVELARTRED